MGSLLGPENSSVNLFSSLCLCRSYILMGRKETNKYKCEVVKSTVMVGGREQFQEDGKSVRYGVCARLYVSVCAHTWKA